MTDLWSELKTTSRPIVLYGMGDGADKMISVLNSIGKTPAAVFASDGFVRGQSFHGYTVISYSKAKELYPDMIVLVCFGTQLADVMDNIKRIAAECTLYAPDLPVYGDGLFTAGFYRDNLQNLHFIYDHLADNTSRRVFDSIVRYKLSGKIDHIIDCETDAAEAYKNILHLSDNERYVDLGAYRGDTVTEFLSYVNGYDKIYAVEPDVKNFKKLVDAYGDTVTCINAAAADKDGAVPFDTRRGRNSHMSSVGDLLPSVSVDSMLGGNAATFIKFDVEGAERQAIEGARQTITQFKPKMCVAAYHRFDDLFSIPMQVLDIRPDYRVYLRHFPYIPAWDTNYYFV